MTFTNNPRLTRETTARAEQLNDKFDQIEQDLAGIVTSDDVQDGTLFFATDAGSANQVLITHFPSSITAYTAGMRATVKKVGSANNGPMTINWNGIALKNLKLFNGQPIPATYLPASCVFDVVYDGTDMRVLNVDPGGANALAAAVSAAQAAQSVIDAATMAAAPGNNSVTNARLADMVAERLKGALVTGDPVDMTIAQALTMLAGITALTDDIALNDVIGIYDLSVTAGKKITPVEFLKVINLLTEDTTPDRFADWLMTYDASVPGLKKVKPSRFISGQPDVLLEHTAASGTNAGTFTQNIDQTRPLNVEVRDPYNLCTLSTNQFTLVAGDYWLEAEAAALVVGAHQAMLTNVTAGSVLLRGTSEFAPGAAGVVSWSRVEGSFTVAASQALELRHRCSTSRATDGMGNPCGFGTEKYASVKLWRLA